jgi:large subunit ribosomal protein L21e
MISKKNVKTRGKIKLSRYFQEFKNGEHVAVIREHSQNPAFPKRIQGRNGIVIGKKGKAYIIKIVDGSLEKFFAIKPIHLTKIQTK